MSATRARVIQMKETPPATRKRRPSPRETKARNGYCHPVTDNILFDALRMARKLRELTDEPYSREAAAISLYLDRDDKKEKTKADYCRIWGWGRTQLDDRWDGLETMLKYWKDKFSKEKTKRSEEEDEKNINADSGTDSQGEKKRRRSEEEDEKKLTNNTSSPLKDIGCVLDAREAEVSPEPIESRSPNPQRDPPSDEAIREWATETGHDPESAKDLANHYRGIGWRNKSGHLILDWHATMDSVLRMKKNKAYRNSHGKSNSRPNRDQPGSGPRSTEEFQRELAERIAKREAEDSGIRD